MNKVFKYLDKNEIEKVSSICKQCVFQENIIVFSAGDRNRDILVIEAGIIDVLLVDAKGNDYIVTQLTDGDVIGEMNFILPLRRTASIKTRTKTKIVTIPYQEFVVLISNEVEISVKIFKAINEILAEKLQNTIALIRG